MKTWNEYVEENRIDNINPFDGLTKAKVKNILYKNISPILKGLFKDEYWQPKTRVTNYLNDANVNWQMDNSFYGYENGKPKSKTWLFTIWFTDNKDKPKKINLNITAHGAGSVKDPLDAYDMTFNIG